VFTFYSKTLNLVVSRCCFAEDGKEMYQNLYRTCRVIVLLIKPFVCGVPVSRRRRVCLSSTLGSLRKHDGNAKKNVALIWLHSLLNFFAIIPTRLICLMQPNYLGAEFVRRALKFRETKRKFTIMCSLSTRNLGCASLGKSKSGFLYPKTDFAFLYLNPKVD